MKKLRIALVSLPMVAAPAAAHANIWVPSFAQCLVAPLPCSLAIYTGIITIPVTLIVSFVEALVLRRYAKGLSLSGAVTSLAFINALTSILGFVFMPHGTEIWPGLPLCYALTVICEALLLLLFARAMSLPRTIRSCFSVSAKMNTASYSLLALVLLVLVWVPQLASETPALRREVSGKLVVGPIIYGTLLVDLSSVPPRMRELGAIEEARPADLDARIKDCRLGTDGRIFGLMPKAIVEMRYAPSGWRTRRVRLPASLSTLSGVSPDMTLVSGKLQGRNVVYDIRARKVVEDPSGSARNANRTSEWPMLWGRDIAFSFDNRFAVACGAETKLVDMRNGSTFSLGNAWSPAFSPRADLLAWRSDGRIVVLDCHTRRQRRLRIPGCATSSLAWSPDGRFIAYLGHPNWFTAQNWTPDARVVDVKTGRSATVHRHVWTAGRRGTLYWLE